MPITDWSVADFPVSVRLEIMEVACTRKQKVAPLIEEITAGLLKLEEPPENFAQMISAPDVERNLWGIRNIEEEVPTMIVARAIRWRMTVADFMELAFRLWDTPPPSKKKRGSK